MSVLHSMAQSVISTAIVPWDKGTLPVDSIAEHILKELHTNGLEVTPLMPSEPQGDGYIYVVIDLHNGAQAMAKRSPNGHWWWESLPASGPGHKRSGTWEDLLNHYGRKLPIQIRTLIPEGEGQ